MGGAEPVPRGGPSSGGTSDQRKTWLLSGSSPPPAPARIYKHRQQSSREGDAFPGLSHLGNPRPEGRVRGLPLHDGEDAREEPLLPVTHQTPVRVDQSFHLGDVGLHGNGAQLVQLLAVQQQVFVPERQRSTRMWMRRALPPLNKLLLRVQVTRAEATHSW